MGLNDDELKKQLSSQQIIDPRQTIRLIREEIRPTFWEILSSFELLPEWVYRLFKEDN